MIILGTLFLEEEEKKINANAKKSVPNAGNSFQWKIIKGLRDCDEKNLRVINVLPVGTWPNHYKYIRLKNKQWSYGAVEGNEVGGINIPILKQISRGIEIRKLLKCYSDEDEILLFTAYLPFLWAVNSMEKDKKITAVITDIPEFYDMHQVSYARTLLRKVHNRLVYLYMKRVDRFILLTEQMKYPLHVGNKPYIVMEGISDVVRPTMEFEYSGFSFLYSGRLNKRYGLGVLLEAFEQVNDPEIELWICGSGEMENDIKLQSKIDKRIKFLGFVSHEKALSLQQQATVLVNPRFNEGEYTKYSFPSKTIEYMAAGKPVMMFHLDGVPKEYDPYLRYIPEETVESMKDTIIQLKNTPYEQLMHLGKEAQKFVNDKKNRTVQAHRILNFINANQKDT